MLSATISLDTLRVKCSSGGGVGEPAQNTYYNLKQSVVGTRLLVVERGWVVAVERG